MDTLKPINTKGITSFNNKRLPVLTSSACNDSLRHTTETKFRDNARLPIFTKSARVDTLSQTNTRRLKSCEVPRQLHAAHVRQ